MMAREPTESRTTYMNMMKRRLKRLDSHIDMLIAKRVWLRASMLLTEKQYKKEAEHRGKNNHTRRNRK